MVAFRISLFKVSSNFTLILFAIVVLGSFYSFANNFGEIPFCLLLSDLNCQLLVQTNTITALLNIPSMRTERFQLNPRPQIHLVTTISFLFSLLRLNTGKLPHPPCLNPIKPHSQHYLKSKICSFLFHSCSISLDHKLGETKSQLI